MKINCIELNEFRCYEKKTFPFHSQFNVLIGENGRGKTALLEALAVAINSFISVIEGRNIRPIRKDDVRRVSFEYSLEAKIDTRLGIVGERDGQKIEWTIAKTHRDWGFQRGNDSSIKDWANRCLMELAANGGKNIILPIFCYMGSGRLWTESTEKARIFPKGSRLEGYHHCLIAKGHFKKFVDWFKTMELSALQGAENARNNVELVKLLISNCLEGWDNIFYSIQDDMLMARRNDGGETQLLPFGYLSDGQRNMIGMVADIAYRCILLNPYLGKDATNKTPGIVLIDELDLHLHPNWQKSIVQKLKESFPAIQFITTTHSPFIVQSLEANELINLDSQFAANIPPDELTLSKVATEIMGVRSIRSDEFDIRYQRAKEKLEEIRKDKQKLTTEDYLLISKVASEIIKDETNDPELKAFLDDENDDK